MFCGCGIRKLVNNLVWIINLFNLFNLYALYFSISSLSRFAESLWGEIMVAKAHGLKIALLKYENFPVSYNVLNLKK